jgi:serine protease Do
MGVLIPRKSLPHDIRPACLSPARPLRRRIVIASLILCLMAGPLLTSRLLAQDASADLEVALALENSVAAAVDRAQRSLVAIARYRKDGPPLDGLPGGRRPAGASDGSLQDRPPNELATGVVIARDGYIVANYHALGDPAENDYKVWVNRRPYWAKGVYTVGEVTAGDPWTDLAVVKIEADDLQPIAMGDADKLRKGQFVVALGNPHSIIRHGQPSASWGIISNLNVPADNQPKALEPDPGADTVYQYGGLIQTDVRLRFGTSGGALVNLRGELVGLVTDLAVAPAYESSLGFAIPVDDSFRSTVEKLKTGRQADFGFLGVAVEALGESWLRDGHRGARVSRVVPGTPASLAKLRPGDVITHINERPVQTRDDLMLQLGKQPAAGLIRLTYRREAGPADRPQIRHASMVLSKRHLGTRRPAFSQIPDPSWRGLQVDYATALPPLLMEQALQGDVPATCLAVVQVQRNSEAWNAGLRPGMLLTHVEGLPASTPQQFHQLVADRGGAVRIRLVAGPVLTVPAPAASR